jgi:hypothetical protein
MALANVFGLLLEQGTVDFKFTVVMPASTARYRTKAEFLRPSSHSNR